MSGLADLKLGDSFRSSKHSLAHDFYAHLLKLSRRFQRAAAYFSSSVFSIAPDEYFDFFSRGGRMQLVCSQHLGREDAAALRQAIEQRPKLRRTVSLERLSGALK